MKKDPHQFTFTILMEKLAEFKSEVRPRKNEKV
jgi:hypothetical protein